MQPISMRESAAFDCYILHSVVQWLYKITKISQKAGDTVQNMNGMLQELEALRAENQRLRQLLKTHGIAISDKARSEEAAIPETTTAVTKRSSIADKISLFMSLFRGRPDVYARRWESKDGRAGYSPVCLNEWKQGICLKPKGKCADCKQADYAAYDTEAIATHLSGQCVLGIYPLLNDETCRFLAIDFDEENWRTDVRMVAHTCRSKDIPCSIESSRSGNGAHLWIFFSDAVDAAKARTLGSTILTLAMKEHARLSFKSYDRMFPNQDTMPKGGFGNLIALPLQVSASRHGGSLFVDEQLQPYSDQWVYLSSVQRMSSAQVDNALARLHTSPLGELLPDDDTPVKPWHRRVGDLREGDAPSAVTVTLADGLYIPTAGFSSRAQNQLKRLAAFRNPQFYRNQALRMPVWNIPRVICCAEYQEGYLRLPRGCMDDLAQWMQENRVNLTCRNECTRGRSINVTFNGVLRDEQSAALQALSAYDNGILSATTAFGKTVIGAALIAEKKVNTLILVHRAQLMEQWQERLSQFLTVNEDLPVLPKRRGRQKKREIIGLYGANRDTRSGVIDIAMLQSMGSADEIRPWIGNYGMVIVDECHHVPAVSFEQVLKAVRSQYVYGLTATPRRQDGHHPILHMYIGGIRYHVDAKQQAAQRPFAHVMLPRFTGARFTLDGDSKTPLIGQYYDQIMQDDARNHRIIEDVLHCVKEGRSCLLLSERTQHVQALATLLRAQTLTVHVLLGGQTSAQMREKMTALRSTSDQQPLIICATGKYIGEGFDDSRLDTLFLTMPISWQGTLAQYVGRLHRLHEGKREVRVYDYIDNHAVMLEKMYRKRLKGYAMLGYSVSADQQDAALGSDIIYDQNSFQEKFLHDVSQARESVHIVSPFVTIKRVCWIENAIRMCRQQSVQVSIITRSPDSLPPSAHKAADTAIELLTNCGASILRQDGIHQKFAIIDGRIVWYGSINLLSFGASQESIMRLVSSSVARALRDSN